MIKKNIVHINVFLLLLTFSIVCVSAAFSQEEQPGNKKSIVTAQKKGVVKKTPEKKTEKLKPHKKIFL